MGTKIEIVVVDDHPVMAQALADLISRQEHWQVARIFSTGRGLMNHLALGRIDLVILDLSLGNGDGVEMIKSIRASDPQQKILIFSMHDEMDYAYRTIFAGARGYLMKDHAAEEVVNAISTVLEGKIYLSEPVKQLRPEHLDRGPRQLTDREFAIFEMLGRGLSSREIAANLFLSPKTVEKHRENIKGKLGIANTPKLIAEAARWVSTACADSVIPHP